ncbi:MAG: TetR/AcrR family transcriptional regulator [Vicinamibacterales bacterium]
MSPRKKTASDDEILEAAARVLARVGPTHLRLADVAAEVGLAPATLIQRFETKRGLLLAVARRGGQAMAAQFAERRRQARSPLDAVTQVGTCVRRLADTPQTLANSLAILQLGLTDPEFGEISRAHERLLHAEIKRLLQEAIDDGEIAGATAQALARAVVALVRGSLLTWGFRRTGAPDAWIRQDLNTLFAGYRQRRPAAARRRARPA